MMTDDYGSWVERRRNDGISTCSCYWATAGGEIEAVAVGGIDIKNSFSVFTKESNFSARVPLERFVM